VNCSYYTIEQVIPVEKGTTVTITVGSTMVFEATGQSPVIVQAGRKGNNYGNENADGGDGGSGGGSGYVGSLLSCQQCALKIAWGQHPSDPRAADA
jgi:hypothetical protein